MSASLFRNGQRIVKDGGVTLLIHCHITEYVGSYFVRYERVTILHVYGEDATRRTNYETAGNKLVSGRSVIRCGEGSKNDGRALLSGGNVVTRKSNYGCFGVDYVEENGCATLVSVIVFGVVGNTELAVCVKHELIFSVSGKVVKNGSVNAGTGLPSGSVTRTVTGI